jgi:hypothetical protein
VLFTEIDDQDFVTLFRVTPAHNEGHGIRADASLLVALPTRTPNPREDGAAGTIRPATM